MKCIRDDDDDDDDDDKIKALFVHIQWSCSETPEFCSQSKSVAR